MRLGLATPVVIQIPGVASNWEAQAGAEDLGLIAAAADKLGFAYLTCSEHVAVPDDAAAAAAPPIGIRSPHCRSWPPAPARFAWCHRLWCWAITTRSR